MRKLYITLVFMLLCLAQNIWAQPASFGPRGIGGGGALFFPRINPANDNEFYVACDMSEMFHSTDYGNTYSQMDFTKVQALNVSTYEFTNDANTAYTNFNDGNEGYPIKTTDGGATWVPVAGYDASMDMVYSMRANYNNPNQLLMDYYGEIVISNDGGATFSVVADAADMGVGLIMGGVFFDGSNIYIGTNQGVYTSTDAGVTWSTMTTTGIPATEVIWQFAAGKSGSTTRFACITGLLADIYNGIMPYDYYGLVANVYTMDNTTGTWVNKTGTINTTSDFVEYIGMAWNDPNVIYLGGSDGTVGAPLVYKSADGGSTWSSVFKTTNNQNIITGWEGDGGDKQWTWGETCFGMSVAPMNSSKAMFGSYSDVHLTSDGGTSWKQAYVNIADQHAANAMTPTKTNYHSIGLENTTCWQVTWQSPSHMMSAFSDIDAIRSVDSGTSWSYNYNGNSANTTYRIATTPGGRMFSGTSNIHDMYQSTRLHDAQLDASDANGNINYSTDGGANWSLLHAFGHPVFWVAIDPNDSNKMYASVIDHAGGVGGIWMTSNLNSLSGSTWTQLAAPPRTEGHPASIVVLNDGKVLCTYSGRISTGSTFTASSGVFLYDPGTNTWADVSDVNQDYWTKDVVVDPSDATQNTWYAAVFTNWGSASANQGGLYKTTNRGTSWTKLTGTQFDRVTSVTLNPTNASQAFLTTETQGLWMTSNINAASPTWTLVSSYPFRQPERVYFNPYNTNEMWVSSFGNGMRMGLMTDTTTTTGVPTFANPVTMKVYPNPTNSILNIELPAQHSNGGTIDIYSMDGKLAAKAVRGNDNAIHVNMSTWKAGIYIVYYNGGTINVVKD